MAPWLENPKMDISVIQLKIFGQKNSSKWYWGKWMDPTCTVHLFTAREGGVSTKCQFWAPMVIYKSHKYLSEICWLQLQSLEIKKKEFFRWISFVFFNFLPKHWNALKKREFSEEILE